MRSISPSFLSIFTILMYQYDRSCLTNARHLNFHKGLEFQEVLLTSPKCIDAIIFDKLESLHDFIRDNFHANMRINKPNQSRKTSILEISSYRLLRLTLDFHMSLVLFLRLFCIFIFCLKLYRQLHGEPITLWKLFY